MKKQLIAVAIVLTVFGGLAALMPQVSAESKFVGSERGNITLAKDKTHNGSYYAASYVLHKLSKLTVQCSKTSVSLANSLQSLVVSVVR